MGVSGTMVAVMSKAAIFALRTRWLDALLFGVGAAASGILTGIAVAAQTDVADGSIDPTHYQNFTVATGGITGMVMVLLGLVLYWFNTRGRKYKSGRLLLFGTATGAITNVVTYCVATVFATSYGMARRTGAVVITDGFLSAVVGGGLGAAVTAVMSAVRSYGD